MITSVLKQNFWDFFSHEWNQICSIVQSISRSEYFTNTKIVHVFNAITPDNSFYIKSDLGWMMWIFCSGDTLTSNNSLPFYIVIDVVGKIVLNDCFDS